MTTSTSVTVSLTTVVNILHGQLHAIEREERGADYRAHTKDCWKWHADCTLRKAVERVEGLERWA